MKIPVIGISGSIMKDQGGMFPGYGRAYVNDDYIQAILRAGGIPIILPIINDKDKLKACMDKVDGIVLSGGHDVNPLAYGEEPDVKTTEIFPQRDTYDFELIRCAEGKGIPVLGICRGMQVINTYFGGSNYQDISYSPGSNIKHWQGHTPELATHTILIEQESKLGIIFGSDALVNSFHHQSIKRVANGFKVIAQSKDGLVEAIEKDGNQWCLGLQFHPEMMAKTSEKMQLIFDMFIKATME